MQQAYQLGQKYWQQADSESYAQNKKSIETDTKFYALIDEVRVVIANTPNVKITEVNGTRWIVTREVRADRCGPEMIAICRNEDLAISVIKARPDYNNHGQCEVEYDCIEVDNFE